MPEYPCQLYQAQCLNILASCTRHNAWISLPDVLVTMPEYPCQMYQGLCLNISACSIGHNVQPKHICLHWALCPIKTFLSVILPQPEQFEFSIHFKQCNAFSWIQKILTNDYHHLKSIFWHLWFFMDSKADCLYFYVHILSSSSTTPTPICSPYLPVREK